MLQRLHTAEQLPAGDRSALARRVMAGLVVLLLAAMAASLLTGASDASLWRLLGALLDGTAASPELARDRLIILDIRLPRLLLGTLLCFGGGGEFGLQPGNLPLQVGQARFIGTADRRLLLVQPVAALGERRELAIEVALLGGRRQRTAIDIPAYISQPGQQAMAVVARIDHQ